MHFSEKEKHDLLIAWVLISIACAIAFKNGADFGIDATRFSLWQLAILGGITFGLAFFVHELAHKYTAQRYGKYAEFHAYIPMLVVSVFLSYFGIVLAAPGAVYISGYSSRREMGHIAVAGPLANIVMALVVLPLFFLIHVGFWATIIQAFYVINAWLALFNMIPLFILDGAKVLHWSKRWYFVTLLIALVLFFVPMLPR